MTLRRLLFALILSLALWLDPLWLPLVPVALFMPVFAAGCTIFSDDFSTDQTGTAYSVRSGSWSVSGGVLTCTSASALLKNLTSTGSATGIVVRATMTFGSTSDRGRIVLGYVDDSNYWFAEVQPGSSNGTLKLYQRSGGTDTQRGSTVTATGLTTGFSPTVCMSASSAGVAVSVSWPSGGNSSLSYTATAPTIGSTYCGLGTGSGSSSLTFDVFSIGRHPTDNATCVDCSCTTYFSDTLQGVGDLGNYDQRAGTWTQPDPCGFPFNCPTGFSTTSSNALVVPTTTTVPSTATGVHATVVINAATSSDAARFILGYVDDSNYWFFEAQPGASATLKLYQRSGGTNTQIGQTHSIGFVAGSDTSFCFSMAPNAIVAGVGANDSNHVWASATPTVASTKVGCGSGSVSSSVTFKTLIVKQHRVDNSSCGDCQLLCDSGCTPEWEGRLQIDIAGIANTGSCASCTDLNGTYVLTPRNDVSPVGSCAWCNFSVPTPCATGGCTFTACGATGTQCSVTAYIDGSHTLFVIFSWLAGSSYEGVVFNLTNAARPDCRAWSGTSVPFVSSSAVICDGSAATCTITALGT